MKYIYNEENFELSEAGQEFMELLKTIVPDGRFSNTHFLLHESLNGYIVSIFKSKEQLSDAGVMFATHYSAPRITPEAMTTLFNTQLVRWIDAGVFR